MTIKKKIVIWYTIWMALLAVILIFVIFVSSGTMMRREMVSELEEAVHDAYDDLEWRRGQYDFDEIDEYDDGVFIQIFSSDGTLLFGRNESEFPSDFAVGRFRESGEWVIFEQGFEDGLIIRSLMRSYIAAGFINSVSVSALVFLPVIVILAAVGGYIITRRSFKPADQAISAAIDISSSNDLSKRINLGDGNDEIHKMASTFDRVLDRLEEAFQKEKQFTSDASHELRTPLAVIKAECEYALEHTDDSTRCREGFESVERQADRMTRLVDELLMLARSDKGRLEPDYERFNLSDLVEMVCETLSDKAGEKSLSVNVKTDEMLYVDADQGMLTRVVINLLNNAIQYTGEGGWILVKAYKSGNDAVLSVEDNGCGIQPEQLEHVWDRFYQVDSARSTGAGLGLSIVKSIVNAHDGSVSAQSTPGAGSVFTVKIPFRKKENL